MGDWKQKLKERTQGAAANKDSRGMGRKSILDLSQLKLPLWTPKGGRDKNCIDIMPWKVSQSWYRNLRTRAGMATGLDIGDVDYKLEIPRHSKVGPGQDLMLCLREAFGKNDAVCEDMFAEYAKRKEGKDFDKEKARSLQPSWRCFYIIYDYDDDKKGFQLWEISYELFEKFLLEEIQIAIDKSGLVVPWDLSDGRSIEFKGREKQIGKNKFIEAEAITFIKRDPYSENILDELPSLDKALLIPTYEEIRAAHYGMAEDEKEEEGHSDPPPAQQEQTRTRNRGGSSGTTETPPAEKTQERTRGRSAESKEEPAKSTSSGECPAGGKFGSDCGNIEACKQEPPVCSDEVYEACLKKHEDLSKEAEAAKAAAGTGTSPGGRRRGK